MKILETRHTAVAMGCLQAAIDADLVSPPSPAVLAAQADVPSAWTRYERLPSEFQKSTDTELERLKSKEAYIIVKEKNVPKDAKIIGSTTPHKYTRKHIAKTRACVRGDQMRDMMFRSYNPTLMHSSLRALLAISAARDLRIEFGDFELAYLHAINQENECYYMRPPTGAEQYDEDGDAIVWFVIKSLYGAPPSGRNWYNTIKKAHIKFGYKPLDADPCIFIKHDGDDIIIIGLYVDDTIICYSSEHLLSEYNEKIKSEFDYNSLGPDAGIFGLRIDQSPGYIQLSHPDYITGLSRYVDDVTVVAHTPACLELEKMVNEASDAEPCTDRALVNEYNSIVGSLLYISMTARPDVCYATSMLSRVMSKPNDKVLHEAKRIVHYLIGTKDLGIRFTRHAKLDLFFMADANWSVRHSTSGFVGFLAGGVFDYGSKKQDAIALSTTWAEIIAASIAALEGAFTLRMLDEIGVVLAPADIYIDNKGAHDMSIDDVSNSRSKHIERRHRKIRELVQDGLVVARRVKTDDNVADILTKPLGRARFERFRRLLLNIG